MKVTEKLYMNNEQLIKNGPINIVGFGDSVTHGALLDDVNDELEDYLNSLKIIFQKCMQNGADVIFMTPNMLNTYVAEDTPSSP